MSGASTLLLLLLCGVAHSTRCYSSKGDPFVYTDDEPVEAWMPCDLTTNVTNCCSPRDYCMSNGLCLDAVQDNMMSQQGCTSSDWDEPCLNYCGDTESDAAGLHFLWRCNKQEHCCSNNRTSTCCNDPDVHIFNVEVGLTLHFAPTATAEATTVSTASASDTVTATPTGSLGGVSVIGQLTTASSAGATTSPSASSESSKDDSRNMAIGLGVGVPLGLALIASIVFMAMQLRKKRAPVEEKQEAGVSRNPSNSHYGQNPQLGQNPQFGQYHAHQYDTYNYNYPGNVDAVKTNPSELGMRDPSELGVRDEYVELDTTRGRV